MTTTTKTEAKAATKTCALQRVRWIRESILAGAYAAPVPNPPVRLGIATAVRAAWMRGAAARAGLPS